MQKTLNPFKLWGSWLGLLVGVYATYKETNPFLFLEPFFDFLEESSMEVNIAGGFFVGYALHLILRSMVNSSKAKMKIKRNRNI